MEKIYDILKDGIHSAVISQKQKNVDVLYNKIEIKSFLKAEQTMFQFCFVHDKKVIHQNVDIDEAVEIIAEKMTNEFFQCIIFAKENDVHITSFGKKFKLKKTAPTKKLENISHDKKKNYIIHEDEAADFLIELGVCTKEGKLKKDKYPKFRQINKYLEFIDALKGSFPKNRTIKIVDFGCGKAYLSFALYYYLTKKLGLSAEVLGLDLKKDVVEHCQKLSDTLGYTGLNFKTGDIGEYQSEEGFDMVISLHACDTATDEALYKGFLWKSKIILAVPCCQHELNPQLKSETNSSILRFGLMRERIATIITDTSRVLLLESVGYKCEMAEFIDMEHTPKNVLLKATYTGKKSEKSLNEFKKLKEEWKFEQRLDTLLNK
ncbi:MAG: SAM-dependent methyltransferase [Clostridia bacterium]